MPKERAACRSNIVPPTIEALNKRLHRFLALTQKLPSAEIMLPLPTLLALSLWSTAALQPGVGGYRPMLAAPRVPPTHLARRALLGASSTALSASLASQLASPAAALIKGSTPPAQGSRPKERKCTNIDECEALAAKREQEITAASGSEQAYDRTVGGDRYRNQVEGSGASASLNDSVSFRYRVMRLGKRSSDGLSGEVRLSRSDALCQHALSARFVSTLCQHALSARFVGTLCRLCRHFLTARLPSFLPMCQHLSMYLVPI